MDSLSLHLLLPLSIYAVDSLAEKGSLFVLFLIWFVTCLREEGEGWLTVLSNPNHLSDQPIARCNEPSFPTHTVFLVRER